jgi:hypothetical protein
MRRREGKKRGKMLLASQAEQERKRETRKNKLAGYHKQNTKRVRAVYQMTPLRGAGRKLFDTGDKGISARESGDGGRRSRVGQAMG